MSVLFPVLPVSLPSFLFCPSPSGHDENAITPSGGIPSGEATPETAKEKFERERLSRRQALKKLGMTSAMATFALFSVDDLARMVGKAMQQRAGDNRIAGQLAKEFQQAGIALADLPPSYYQIGINCKYNHNSYGGNASSCSDCVTAGCAMYYGSGSPDTNCNFYAGKYCG